MKLPRSRRDFLTTSIGAPLALSLTVGCSSEQSSAPAEEPTAAAKHFPIGIELYSVRQALAEDLMGTVAKVAEIGYEVVEFYRPYFDWTPEYAKEVRTHMDNLGIKCLSTHNPPEAFMVENRAKAIELNSIIGSQSIIMASPPSGTIGRPGESGDVPPSGTPETWQKVADLLTEAQEAFAAAGIQAGYHNHQYEWRSFEGVPEGGPRFAMDVLAAGTPEAVTLQFDAGTCMEMKRDPVAWIASHPGRIRSVHCKDWAPGTHEEEKGYRVLFGEGVTPWQDIFQAAENGGGVEFYLLEQEGSRYDEFETAKRCLDTWKQMRA
jgi:sugar phosphate isomerase/epimerase